MVALSMFEVGTGDLSEVLRNPCLLLARTQMHRRIHHWAHRRRAIQLSEAHRTTNADSRVRPIETSLLAFELAVVRLVVGW